MNSFDSIGLLISYNNLLVDFYKLVENSKQPELLGWESRQTQSERFRILFEESKKYFNLSEDNTIADVGCGYADLYKYFLDNKFNAKYTGLDISKNYLNEAKKKYPKITIKEYNIFDTKIEDFGVYDIVFMSGVLNLNVEVRINVKDANFKVLTIILSRLMKAAKIGVICNFLHKRSQNRDVIFNYYEPRVLILKLKELGYNVLNYRDDYLHNDFTITISSLAKL